MNVIEAIRTRRAVRSYQARVVDESTLKALLQAAVHAPSALNEQLWTFAIVQDTARLKRWSDQAKRLLLDQAQDPKAHHYSALLADPSFNVFYDASTLIVIGCAERRTYTDADCWLAAQNVMLAAYDAGLGSCPIGFAIPVLNTPEVKEELRFPASAAAVAPIIVGYPSAPPPIVSRADPHVAAWIR